MKAVFLGVCAVLLAGSLAGCSTTRAGTQAQAGTEVTRVHLGQPVARGRIAVEPVDRNDAGMPDFGSYAAAVQAQLSGLGWTVVNVAGQGEQVALVDVDQGSGGVTTLEVSIKRRSDGSVIWEGRGRSAAGAQRLSEALFRDFPGESGRTIRTR